MKRSLIDRGVENAIQSMLDDKALAFAKGVSKMAAKQGGASTLENYQLLGKRTLITIGAVIIGVQAVASVVGFVVSRKSQDQHIERVVRRVLEEEQQKAEAQA